MILMLATSFKKTTRMIGAKNWKRLHTTGIHVLAFVMAITYAARLTESFLYLIALIPLLAVITLRVKLHWAKKRS